jgi:ATP-dependent helicase/DNAse subunit B
MSLRVTAFRDYLASPYRYYLRHVLRLEELTDDLDELDAAAFGTLIHDVLKEFGQSNVRDSSDEQEITRFLEKSVEALAAKRFGPDPLAAVRIQIEQTRLRLTSFARWQSAWREQGWKIHAVERTESAPLVLHDGQMIQVAGRIDRIDFYAESGEWAVFDYKTGEAGATPEKSHFRQGEWCDFQLPLYRHLVRAAGFQGPLHLGFITLPRDTDDVAHHFANWSELELLEADEAVRAIAAKILAEEFWVEMPRPPGVLTEFNAICQTGVFGPEASV